MSGAERRPINPETNQPLPLMAQPGYYPGFKTLSQKNFWDAATRSVVLNRVENPPPIRFFTPEEERTMRAVCARVMPQDDRDAEHQIPLINGIDERLYKGEGDGYRYENMPKDEEAYRLGIRGINQVAEHIGGKPLADLGPIEQDMVLMSIHRADPPAGQEIWDQMPIHRFWMLVVQDVVHQYYAHPYAWDEIGFGGPAYPRAYFRLEHGEPEPWEVAEQRYEWEAPPTSLTSESELLAGTTNHLGKAGEGGTH